MSGYRLAIALAGTLVLALPSVGDAQPPSSNGFFSMLDRNRDGRLDSDELQRSPSFMRDQLERSGVDTRRGVDASSFTRVMDEMRRQREEQGGGFRGPVTFGGGPGGFSPQGGFGDRGGFGGPGGGFGDRGGFGPPGGFGDRGSSDRGSSDRSSSDRDSDRDSDRSRDQRDGDSRGDSRSRSSSSSSSRAPQPRPRITMALPSAFTAMDADHDGQIGLYEWKEARRPQLAEFFALDTNGDGFLTPKELSAPPPSGQPATTTMAVATPAPGTSQAAPSTPSATGTQSLSGDEKARHEAQARRDFRDLDSNHDGALDDSDRTWRESRRVRPQIEAAGFNVKEKMTEAQFLEAYMKAEAYRRDVPNEPSRRR